MEVLTFSAAPLFRSQHAERKPAMPGSQAHPPAGGWGGECGEKGAKWVWIRDTQETKIKEYFILSMHEEHCTQVEQTTTFVLNTNYSARHAHTVVPPQKHGKSKRRYFLITETDPKLYKSKSRKGKNMLRTSWLVLRADGPQVRVATSTTVSITALRTWL